MYVKYKSLSYCLVIERQIHGKWVNVRPLMSTAFSARRTAAGVLLRDGEAFGLSLSQVLDGCFALDMENMDGIGMTIGMDLDEVDETIKINNTQNINNARQSLCLSIKEFVVPRYYHLVECFLIATINALFNRSCQHISLDCNGILNCSIDNNNSLALDFIKCCSDNIRDNTIHQRFQKIVLKKLIV